VHRKSVARIHDGHAGELVVGTADIVETGHAAIPFLIAAPTMRVPMVWHGSTNAYLAARAVFARATDAAGALWLRANRSRAPRSELVNGRSGSFFVRVTPALLGQMLDTAPEVYRIPDHFGKSAVK
jgi:hypothetical protein